MVAPQNIKNRIIILSLFSRQVTSDSLQLHELYRARLPCPSPTPRICSSSCPWGQWCYLIISSSASPFSFCFQFFPASRSVPMNLLQWMVLAKGLEEDPWSLPPPGKECSGLTQCSPLWAEAGKTQASRSSFLLPLLVLLQRLTSIQGSSSLEVATSHPGLTKATDFSLCVS